MIPKTETKTILKLIANVVCGSHPEYRELDRVSTNTRGEDGIHTAAYNALCRALKEKVDDGGHLAKNLKCHSGTGPSPERTFTFGQTNQPDLSIKVNNCQVAIEYVKVDDGVTIRGGIGQGVAYTKSLKEDGKPYDFAIIIFCDNSPRKTISKNWDSEFCAKMTYDNVRLYKLNQDPTKTSEMFIE